MKSALVVAAAFLGGCGVSLERTGPLEHETQSIDLDKSEMVRVEIKMGAGELTVDGGAAKLMDADFTYNIASWKPMVRYTSSGFRGNLSIEQPHGSSSGPDVTYKWNLKLNDKVPLDVITHLGAGEARMNLGSANLRSVEVHMGVGQLILDLRGKPSRDYTVEVKGGVGEAKVYLPREVGIEADAKGGIGQVEVRGLQKRGSGWFNAAQEHSPVTVRVNASGGVGHIALIAE
jgi:N-terminal domain of toast_rack, DUF2154